MNRRIRFNGLPERREARRQRATWRSLRVPMGIGLVALLSTALPAPKPAPLPTAQYHDCSIYGAVIVHCPNSSVGY